MARKLLYIVLGVVASLLLVLPAAADNPHPSMVDIALEAGESFHLDKEVTTPAVPPVIDICLLEDETGSFADDIANLQGGTTASDLFDTIRASSPDSQFAVAGFRDYEVAPHGSAGDHVYRLLQGMSAVKADWLAGVAALTASGGNDFPEAQYDAIVAAGGPGPTDYVPDAVGPQDDCGWRDPGSGAQRVLVVATDAAFHLPGGVKPHLNDQASTVVALDAQGISVLGLKAPGAGAELNNLVAALAAGGSVQALSSDGANIAQAILDGLAELTTDVWFEVGPCDDGLTVTLDPTVHQDVQGNTTVAFEEWIDLADDAAVGTRLHCTVTFIANEFPDEGAPIGEQTIWVKVVGIDIKPFSLPNSINTKSMGLVPVAILSGPGFDATTEVDLTVPITFGSGGANPVHLPFTAAELASHTALDVDENGFNDLVLHFRQKETGIASGDTSACLTFTETDGVVGTACDSVRIVPPGLDSDGDGFGDAVEATVTTDQFAACSIASSHDAWPADVNNDGRSDITDIVAVTASFGQAVPAVPARHDVASDPDGFVDISDIVAVVASFGQSCAP